MSRQAPIHEMQIGPGYKAVVYIDGNEFVSEAKHVMLPPDNTTRHATEPEAIKAMHDLAVEKKERIRGLVEMLRPLAGQIQGLGAEGSLELAEKIIKAKGAE